jgi:RimJ/RimL family protein N-acetyltransferase
MSGSDVSDIASLRGLLRSDRIFLRPFTVADISEDYLGWLKDPIVVRFSSQRFHVHSMKSCQAYLSTFSDSANHFLAICDLKTGLMLGTMTVYRSVIHGTADIGIMVGERKVWGQGIGVQAFCLVLSALEASRLIRKVTAGTLSVNRGMVRILEKANMKHEATRYAQELVDGMPVDVVYYSKFFHD